MKIFASYKLLLFTTIFGIIMNAILFFYFSKLVDSSPNPYLDGSYIYVIYGVAATDLSVVIINRLNNEIRDYQLTGVIDSLLSSNHSDLKYLF